MLSFFGPKYTVDLELSDKDTRKHVDVAYGYQTQHLPLFEGSEDVTGKVLVNVASGKKVEHTGIKLLFVGQIELFHDRGKHFEFTKSVADLAPGGILTESAEFPFNFQGIEKPYESFNGINVRLRYILRVVVGKAYSTSANTEFDLWVHTYQRPPEMNHSIKMEVGIEECLHIEFEYAHSKYHLKDCLVGKIFFLKVRINIKHMEVALIRRETTGSAPNVCNESETITKFEVMDGAPVRGECIPVRLFLGGFELTPTYKQICNKFSVRYYVNLVLVDVDDRRYFKQQEIVLWRKAPADFKPNRKPITTAPDTVIAADAARAAAAAQAQVSGADVVAEAAAGPAAEPAAAAPAGKSKGKSKEATAAAAEPADKPAAAKPTSEAPATEEAPAPAESDNNAADAAETAEAAEPAPAAKEGAKKKKKKKANNPQMVPA